MVTINLIYMPYNVQESSVDEINLAEGIIVTHFTRTWDTAASIDNLQEEVDSKKAVLDAAQADYDASTQKKAALDAQVMALKPVEKAIAEEIII